MASPVALVPGASCAECGVPSSTVCGGCRQASYCSRACQRAAWPAHKAVCARLRKRKLRVLVVGAEGGAGRIHVLANEAGVMRIPNPCMYAGDEAEHIAHPDGRHYDVPGLLLGGVAFVVGRRWGSYITCAPLVCATRAEAVAQAARLPKPEETEIIEVTVE